MTKRILMIGLFYLINFLGWDLVVNLNLLEPKWASVADYSLLFIITIILFRRELKREWIKFKKKIKSPSAFLLELVIWAVIGSILSGIFIFVFGNLLNINLLPENQENVNNMVDQIPAILSFVMMSIYAPFIEEMTFRYSVIGWVDKNNKSLLILMSLISILMFDFIHVINLPEFLYYLPMSILLVLIYWKYDRNPWASIFFHSFFNTFGFILIILRIISN